MNNRVFKRFEDWAFCSVQQSKATKKLEPFEQKGKVVLRSYEDCVHCIALGMCEVVSIHAVFMLDMANDRFDCPSSSHFAFDGWRHAAFLASSEDPEPMTFGSIVSAISSIGENAFNLRSDRAFHLGDDRF